MKKHIEFFLLHKTAFDEESLQALMPPSLRQESVLQIHKVLKIRVGFSLLVSFVRCALLSPFVEVPAWRQSHEVGTTKQARTDNAVYYKTHFNLNPVFVDVSLYFVLLRQGLEY